MSDSSNYPVHLGLWTNWSHGSILGRTLTTSRSHGALLIAFIALFVTLVGSQLWRIICFALHNWYSNPNARDALHNQRQVILRNSGSPVKGLVEFAQLISAWRAEKVQPFYRLLPAFLLAFLLTGALIISSGFSSMISSGNEVLLSSDRCGQINADKVELEDHWLYIHPYYNGMVESAGDYAQRCYETSPEASDCSTFAQRKLPVSINTTAECPFDNSMCLSNDANIFLDTGLLDSHKDLGLNSPPDKRFQYRRTLHCAPLQTNGYKSKITDRRNQTFTRYQYGPIWAGDRGSQCNCSFAFPDSARPISEKTLLETVQPNYLIESRLGAYMDGSLFYNASDFEPSPRFGRTDADLHLIALSARGVLFTEKSADLWYRATSPFSKKISILNQTIEQSYWEAAEPLWPMGCVTQYQYCRNSLPEESRCTKLGSFEDTMTEATNLMGGDEGNEVRWAMGILNGPTASEIIKYLGLKSLTARFNLGASGIQAIIKPNQWQLDVTHWFSTTLASTQLQMLRAVTGPEKSNVGLERVWGPPDTPDQKRLCGSQKIRSTEYMSFSFVGVVLIFTVGAAIIILSAVIEPVTAWVQRRFQLSPYSRLEWQATPKLHLQRLAHEELGYGEWRIGAFGVPITRAEDRLGVLDPSDFALARLRSQSGSLETLKGGKITDYKNSRTEAEGAYLDSEKAKNDLQIHAQKAEV